MPLAFYLQEIGICTSNYDVYELFFKKVMLKNLTCNLKKVIIIKNKLGEEMKEFIEKTLHQKIELVPFDGLDSFPLVFRANYDFYTMKIEGLECILAVPKEDVNLSTLRKQYKRISQITGRYCVLYLKKLNYYTRDKLLEEGIPFIWEERQVYMTFVGILLQQNETRDLKPCYKISFLTQKLLLTAIYDEWDNVSVTEAAEKLGVSKMSVTRVFDEIESLDIPVLKKVGRSRRYARIGDKKEIWEKIKMFLRSPLLREYRLENEFTGQLVKSGISALAELSMLGDNPYPTYGITKYDIRKKEIDREREVPRGELPGCIIQELGYCIPFKDDQVIDPLTVYLLLNKEDDPRIEIALEEMMEEYVW